MMTSARFGAVAIVGFALAGIVWFALELAPPRLGFGDTDDAATSLRFLRAHSEIYIQAGTVLIFMAIALTVGTFVVADALAPRADALALRSVSAFGLFSAAFFFMHGVVRFSAEPLLYIDSLNHDWGEAAYIAVQMIGIHGFAQAAIFALAMWAVGICLIGSQTRAIPLALVAMGVLPAFRLVALLLGPMRILPDGLWILAILSIPGTLLWTLALGLVLLRQPSESRASLGA